MFFFYLKAWVLSIYPKPFIDGLSNFSSSSESQLPRPFDRIFSVLFNSTGLFH